MALLPQPAYGIALATVGDTTVLTIGIPIAYRDIPTAPAGFAWGAVLPDPDRPEWTRLILCHVAGGYATVDRPRTGGEAEVIRPFRERWMDYC